MRALRIEKERWVRVRITYLIMISSISMPRRASTIDEFAHSLLLKVDKNGYINLHVK
jgi:hypothetical protein